MNVLVITGLVMNVGRAVVVGLDALVPRRMGMHTYEWRCMHMVLVSVVVAVINGVEGS